MGVIVPVLPLAAAASQNVSASPRNDRDTFTLSEQIGAPPARDLADIPSESRARHVGDMIVYTAHQGWLSRIYLLRMDGSVIRYFEYDFYFFADFEVVDNEVYAAEAFAPRVYLVDLDTGELEVVVDDWTLYYFYGLAFDGTYFYLNEWDLNRYELDGTKDGMASFDESVAGAAWDGTYYWTLNDEENLIKCWDVSGWPSIVEVPPNAFTPPTPFCRGLWFDGQYFWTAESIEDTLGHIYRFDYDGQIKNQWLEPAFQGWSACVVSAGLLGDFDSDEDVDADDFDAFQSCFTGPDGGPVGPACEPGDFDWDGDVDCDDWEQFTLAWTGPGDPPEFPVCMISAPLPALPPYDALKNRYLSFNPNHGGYNVAYHVELTAAAYFPESTGILGWVGEPDDNDVSRLLDNPFYCAIVPVAAYEIRATADGNNFTDPLEVSTIAQPDPTLPKWWADIVGMKLEDSWSPPDGFVNMDDIQAAVQTFEGVPGAPHWTWVDIEDEVPNAVINMTDVQLVVLAFEGAQYPFSAPADCPQSRGFEQIRRSRSTKESCPEASLTET
jgi:hypothetical protein